MKTMIFVFILCVFILCISSATASQYVGHSGEKKQFVTMGMFGGRGMDSFSGNIDNGFGNFDHNGGMELNENSMGNLNLQSENDGGIGSLLSGSQFGGWPSSTESMSTLGGGPGYNSIQQFAPNNPLGLNNQGTYGNNDLGIGQEQLSGRAESLFNSLNEDNEGDSLFGINSLEGNYETSLNDGTNNAGIGQMDMNSFEDTNSKEDSSLLNGYTPHHKDTHKIGSDRQGIGDGGEMLSNEIGQLDSSDEKLQKMLEFGLSGDNYGESNENNAETAISALLNPQYLADQMDSQQSSSPDELPSFQHEGNSNEHDVNQLSSSLSEGHLGDLTPITVHAHASDKQDKTPPSLEETRQTAMQVQETAARHHRKKLARLKKRLQQIRLKLQMLQAEQAKKSTSNTNNDPKESRNDAIKKLLIKNLKLAAMIASKEIQLEETKSKSIAYLSGKKDQDSDVFHDTNHMKSEPVLHERAKPLTELSKKAEEEVNHLSKNPDLDKYKNNSRNIRIQPNSSINKINLKDSSRPDSGANRENSNTFLKKINETLQILDHTSPDEHTRSSLTSSSKRFFNKLKKQIQSMSPDQAQAIEERALSNLYKAIKNKTVRRKSTIKVRKKT
ncbi:uncharacterized protein LOC100211549 isoform X1 [Hydra vulgaris]|uniref:uncharacterized protein LOC100211549 isoform X1 n=1 Tax=Hydra vulgaris TaxID=6087 RepID=UPI001F5E6818|nr:uncharacterized protein LOC100211549 isoform X1 [Hydra vulgaris]